jgi:hypothetical protein
MARNVLGLTVIVVLMTFNLGGGCASNKSEEHPNRIPQMADVVVEGNDKIKWTADMDGTIFVYDRDKSTVRYTGPVRRGEEIIVQPDRDKVYVGDHVVYNENLEKHSWHRIYFLHEQDAQQ